MPKGKKLRMRFGRRVRELRQKREMSLETLGEHAGVNDKYIQSVETARQSPTLDIVEKIAEGLGVRVVELFSEELPATTRERAAKLLDQVDDDDLRRIVTVLQAFAGR